MPEGDTIHRAAASLRPALVGHALDPRRAATPPPPLAGGRRDRHRRRGPRQAPARSAPPTGLVVHTHQRMTGLLAPLRAPAERWRKSPRAARVVLGVRGPVAVCFASPGRRGARRRGAARATRPCGGSAPTCATRPPTSTTRWPGSAGCRIPDRTDRRGAARPARRLRRRQRLPLRRAVPPRAAPDHPGRCARRGDTPVACSRRPASCCARNLDAPPRTTTVAGARPARCGSTAGAASPAGRCGTPIAVGRLGEQARVVYWCPTCQPAGDRAPRAGRDGTATGA